MIAVVQRVLESSVEVREQAYRASTGPGLCVLLGVEAGDTPAQSAWMAAKLAHLRIFRDEEGKMNRSVLDLKGEILLVSQFTLVGDCSRGNRPSFVTAADPTEGERLYEEVARDLRERFDLPVRTGVFGAMMEVRLVNDGPVTLILKRSPGPA